MVVELVKIKPELKVRKISQLKKKGGSEEWKGE